MSEPHELPDAAEWATLLGGHVRPETARPLAALKGVYYLPQQCLLLVTPAGMLRMMSRGQGRAQWSAGRLEIEVDGHTLVLSPADSWHPDCQQTRTGREAAVGDD